MRVYINLFCKKCLRIVIYIVVYRFFILVFFKHFIKFYHIYIHPLVHSGGYPKTKLHKIAATDINIKKFIFKYFLGKFS